MEYKKANWQQSRANENIWSVEMPFGKYLEVMFSKGSYKWEMHDLEEMMNCGRCNTLQKAMEHAEKAFQKYVEDNLAKC